MWDNSTKNTANESKMSVTQAQAAFKEIVKNNTSDALIVRGITA